MEYTTQEQRQFMEAAQKAYKTKQAKAQRQQDTGGNRRRWQVYNSFCDLNKRAEGLHPADVAVWFVLFRHADRQGIVSLSQTRMVTYTGLAQRSIQRALQRLVTKGMIERLKRGGPKSGLAVYKVVSQWR